MKKLIVLSALLLGACGSVQTYYDKNNFQTLPWSSQSQGFEQASATCRYENLSHEWLGDTYELQVPKYRACMEKYGYRYKTGM